jgi:hypothetical protein
VEYDLRFRYVKFTKCHNDILSYTLKEMELDEYIPSIPPIHLYLELGACSKTMISLISMGVSRTGASILADKAPRTNMDVSTITEWLKKQNLVQLELPANLSEEIKHIV